MTSSSWSEHKLGDLIQINPDALNKTYPYSEIEYLDISSVGTGFYTEVRRLKLEEAPSRAKRLVSDGDTIISTVRPGNKSYCYLKKTTPRMVVSTGFAVLRAKKDLLDERFLYYLVSNPAFTEYLVAHEKGAAYPAVGTETIENAIVNIPDLPTQKKISDILGSLDDKIELNRRMNETLEQMAMALYKYWFVDFGPFSDIDENGLPIGWRWGTLEEIGYTYKDQVDPTELDYQLPYIGLEHMPKGSISLEEWEYSDKVSSNKFLFDKGDILFGKLRPYFKKVGVAPVNGVCSTDILVIRPKSDVFFGLLFAQVIQDEFIDYCSNTSNGTKMPRCDWNQMAKFKLPIPSDSVLIDFNKKIKSFVGQVISNIHENRMLIETRDYLLPRLLSGEIEVREAEEQVEEVLAHA